MYVWIVGRQCSNKTSRVWRIIHVHEEQLTPHDEESEETESSVSVNPGSAKESTSTKERSEKRVISLQKHL